MIFKQVVFYFYFYSMLVGLCYIPYNTQKGKKKALKTDLTSIQSQ